MSGHIDMVGPFSLSSDVLVNVGFAASQYETNIGSALDMMPIKLGGHPGKRRQLSAENSSNITGTLVMGDIIDKEKYPFDHFLKVNGTGLPFVLMIAPLLLDWPNHVIVRRIFMIVH
jgi:hypothetical protein